MSRFFCLMKLITEPYVLQLPHWPKTGRYILAQYDDETVVVYQAFTHAIADYAVQHQHFGGEAYKLERMSWIKPNFLWMMHRSGWASKEGQERVLALWLRRDKFDLILSQAVHSKFEPDVYIEEASWKSSVNASSVRLQWDPDYSPKDGRLERRAMQLGLRGDILKQFAQGGWLTLIEDITNFVHEQKKHISDDLILPRERVYPVMDAEVAKRLQLS